MKVLVVGAGPTGLTAANELIRNNIIPRVVERRSTESNLSRAVGILPKTLERYEKLNITETLIAEGVHIKNLNIYHNNKLVLDLDITGLRDKYDYILSLPQDRTERILENRFNALGGTVEYGAELDDISQDENGKVIAYFADGSSEEFDYVIGADGSRSKVRTSLGIELDGYDLPETWHISDIYIADDNSDCAKIIKQRDAISFVIRMADKRYRIVSSTEIDLSDSLYGFTIDKVFRKSSFKISIKQARSYVKGSVILCGDAAHTHSPVGGRGMNLGIADAFESVDAILKNDLQGYNDKQHKKGAEIIKMTETIRKFVLSKNIFKKILFMLGIFVVSKSKLLQKKIAKKMTTF